MGRGNMGIKIYHGILHRYWVFIDMPQDATIINTSFIKEVDCNFLILPNSDEWNDKTMGSYKLVDNGNGTYDSFRITKRGQEISLSQNRQFDQKDLQYEIDNGHLVLQ